MIQTNSGLSLNIFTEVVGSCSSISGHVGGTGVSPLAGIVYSPGFDAIDCLDEAGNYKLERVFRGHFRTVVVVYWVLENGHAVKNREERTIDFFNGDLTGFDLPDMAQPTPTPTWIDPLDDYYEIPISVAISQYLEWQNEYGIDVALQKTIDWINSEINNNRPLFENVKEADVGTTEGIPTCIVLLFKNDVLRIIDVRGDHGIPTEVTPNQKNLFSTPFPSNFKETQQIDNTKVNLDTFHPANMIVLSPWSWEFDPFLQKNNTKTVQYDIADQLDKDNYDIDIFRTTLNMIDITPVPSYSIEHPVLGTLTYPASLKFTIKPGEENNIVRPDHFSRLDQYGIIYVHTHITIIESELATGGFITYISCQPIYESDEIFETWKTLNRKDENRTWYVKDDVCTQNVNPDYLGRHYQILCLSPAFFETQDFNDKFIYMNCCYSARDEWVSTFFTPDQGIVYLGNSKKAGLIWDNQAAYTFFSNFIDGSPAPFSVGDSYHQLTLSGLNPDPNKYPKNPEMEGCMLNIYPEDTDLVMDTYFPVPVEIIVHDYKENISQ